jgi:carbonic anhydrase
MCKRLERRIRATPSAPHPSYAYKLASAPVRFARNSLPHPPTGTHARFVQKRTRNAKLISMSCMDSRFRGRKCQLALPFPPAEAKLLVTGHRPRHEIAAGLGAIPDAAVSNIFRRNAGSFRSSRMKSALSARQCRKKSRLVSRIFTRQFPFLTACDSRLGVVQSCGLRYPKT